jgi:cytochrome P450
MKPFTTLTHVIRNPEAHKERRKLLSRGYSQQNALAVEHEITAKIQTLLDRLNTEASKTGVVDVYPWVHLLSFDIVCTQRFSFKHSAREELTDYL